FPESIGFTGAPKCDSRLSARCNQFSSLRKISFSSKTSLPAPSSASLCEGAALAQSNLSIRVRLRRERVRDFAILSEVREDTHIHDRAIVIERSERSLKFVF